jgi:hypothetical protein
VVESAAVARLRDLLHGPHAYAVLLALVAFSAIYTVATPETDGWHLGNILIQAAIVFTAVSAARPRQKVGRFLDTAAIVAVVLSLVSLISTSDSQRDFALIAATLAALVPIVVARGLFREVRSSGASERVIAGALSIYLMIGMLCAYVYGAISTIGNGALFADGKGDGDSAIHVYFSFITQTTVGYGDYAPGEAAARAVAMAQALTGQLYLVTVVSLLVGSFLGARSRADGS